MNTTVLIGNVGNDVKVTNFENGGITASLSLATKEIYKNNSGEKVEDTQWHQIVAYGKTAEYLQKYVKKGDSLAINGKIRYRSYDGKEGVKIYLTEIIAKSVTHFSKAGTATANDDEE
jgi:single-strand DNA-binding protein